MNLWQNKYSLLWWTGLVVSKPDLVTFLEQVRSPGIEGEWRQWPYTQVCVNGWSRWLKWEVQVSVRKAFFVMWFGKICFIGNDFGEVWIYFCRCHRQLSPAPFCLLNQSWIHLQWLLFSFTVRAKILLLACDNLHELAAFSLLGDPRKTVHTSEWLYDAPFKVCFYLQTELCKWSHRHTAKVLGIVRTDFFFFFLIYSFQSIGNCRYDLIHVKLK